MERLLRVVLTGSESTGKTTLAADLAAHYRTVWSPEFARAYADRKKGPLDRSDVEPIARGQIAGEDEAARRAGRLLILDTDLLSTVVYGRHYYGRFPEWIEKAAAPPGRAVGGGRREARPAPGTGAGARAVRGSPGGVPGALGGRPGPVARAESGRRHSHRRASRTMIGT